MNSRKKLRNEEQSYNAMRNVFCTKEETLDRKLKHWKKRKQSFLQRKRNLIRLNKKLRSSMQTITGAGEDLRINLRTS
jgi:hypothetical protein